MQYTVNFQTKREILTDSGHSAHRGQRRNDLVGQTFLELEAARKYIDDLYATKYIDILTSAS